MRRNVPFRSTLPTDGDGGGTEHEADRWWQRDRPWLVLSLATGCLVAVVYLLTHPYPAFGAGLYLEIVERIVAGGYALPRQIPHYTTHGIPFGYPPLAFYVSAVLADVGGVSPLALSRYLPAALTVLYLVPYYYLSRELLETPARAGVATILLAVTPPVLEWHLSAGGMVRAVAFTLALSGCYTGIRLFRTHDGRWAVASTVLFGLTVLTHPVYTVFFGLSYLLFYVAFDRTVRGLGLGAGVAVGGVALASPWWLLVVRLHGVGVFTAAAGTHTGLFGGPHRLLDQFVYPLVTGPPIPVFFLGAFAGAFYLLGRRRFLLPAWLVSSAVTLGKSRFQFVAGSMLTAVFLLSVVAPTLHDWASDRDTRRVVWAVVALIGLTAVVLGVLYAGGALPAAHHGSPSQPQFITHGDVQAMTWVSAHTASSADFVVLGDAAEWFPLYANRTILVGPWGAEWTTPRRYRRELDEFRTLSTCTDRRCVTTVLARNDLHPKYLYVPRRTYTVRGLQYRATGDLQRSLNASGRYRLVFQNGAVGIYRVVS